MGFVHNARVFLEGFVIGATFPIQIIIYILKKIEKEPEKEVVE
jgi:hypothetical protein